MASDDFNRADAGTLGANWTKPTWSGTNNLGIFSNGVDRSPDGNFGVGFYTGTASPADQFGQFTIVTLPTALCCIYLRGLTGTVQTFYGCGYDGNNFAGNVPRIWKSVAGVMTSLGTSTHTWVAGDVVKGQVVGSTIKLFINGVEKLSVTDTALASGESGIQLDYTAENVRLIDDWSGGAIGIDLVAASSVVFTAAAPLTTQIPLSALVSIVLQAAGVFTTQIRFVGAGSIVFTTVGELPATGLAAQVLIPFSGLGNLTTAIRLAAAALISITAAGDIPTIVLLRYGFRVINSSTQPSARVPQYIVVTNAVDLPTTDVGRGDLGFDLATGVLWKWTGASWVAV